MNQDNGMPLDFARLLEPARELRQQLEQRRDELTSEIQGVREQIAELDRVFKAAGLMAKGNTGPRPRSIASESKQRVSPETLDQIVAFIAEQGEATVAEISEKLGIHSSTGHRAVRQLRREERIRFIRNEEKAPGQRGHGHKVYGVWARAAK